MAMDHLPVMPTETLSSIPGTLRVDTVRITNGGLKYGERFAVGTKPAVITFDSMHVLVEGITNREDSGSVVVIEARGVFMNAGTMNLRMSIPLASPGLSYDYSGSLSRMDLRASTPFWKQPNGCASNRVSSRRRHSISRWRRDGPPASRGRSIAT